MSSLIRGDARFKTHTHKLGEQGNKLTKKQADLKDIHWKEPGKKLLASKRGEEYQAVTHSPTSSSSFT